MKNKNIFKKIGGEFFIGILEFLGTTFESKISFGVFLIITGGGILLSPITQGIDLTIQYILGSILIVFALFLFIWRIEEIKNEKNQNK
ncbi:hypothetical protein [Epilithonimonas sp. UC225_85]|uniref:hypothetical protein n=1 Tax=Epilithonimonas sp. UC225_85 TaxID=3350167 RepID=UPI0036D3E195